MTLSSAEIARIEEARQALGTAEIAVDREALAGGYCCYSAPGSWSNQAAGLGLNGPVDDAELDRLVDFYRERDADAVIEVCPFVDPSLIAGLAVRGFHLEEFENVLARPLDPAAEEIPAAGPFGWPEGLAVEQVDPADGAAVKIFIEVSSSGFLPPGAPVSADLFDLTRRMVEHPRTSAYLALVDGEPAGGGAIECGPPGACLFGTTVLPAFRRRGIQSALILARLARARDAGCAFACIHSSPGIPTERNATRAGFSLAYTKVVLRRPLAAG